MQDILYVIPMGSRYSWLKKCCPRLQAKEATSWAPTSISLLSDYKHNVATCPKPQPPCLPCHSKLYLSSEPTEPFLLCFVTRFDPAVRWGASTQSLGENSSPPPEESWWLPAGTWNLGFRKSMLALCRGGSESRGLMEREAGSWRGHRCGPECFDTLEAQWMAEQELQKKWILRSSHQEVPSQSQPLEVQAFMGIRKIDLVWGWDEVRMMDIHAM